MIEFLTPIVAVMLGSAAAGVLLTTTVISGIDRWYTSRTSPLSDSRAGGSGDGTPPAPAPPNGAGGDSHDFTNK